MLQHPERNYFINVALSIMGFICAVTGILLYFRPRFINNFASSINYRQLHIWTGFIITALVLVHLLMHTTWIKNMTKNIFTNKKSLISLVLTILISLGICFAIQKSSPSQKKSLNNRHIENNFNRRGFKNNKLP